MRSKRTRCKPCKALGDCGAPITGMVSIDGRPEEASDRRVPGSWKGNLGISKDGRSSVATFVERLSRFLIMLGRGQRSAGAAARVADLGPDQGTEMACHAQLSVATELPVYFAHPHSPWERGTDENTKDSSVSICQRAKSSRPTSPIWNPYPRNSTTGREQSWDT